MNGINKSVWEKGVERVRFNKIEGDTETDVLIIGGGIAGILCAYRLKEAGVRCILAEASHILSGTTKNTTAKITLAHGLIYQRIEREFDRQSAALYLDAQLKACREYARLASKIRCDYETGSSYVYSLRGKERIEKETELLRSLGVNAEISGTEELPFLTDGAVRVKNQAHFNPLKFLFALAEDLSVYENTKVLELAPKRATTERGIIRFDRLIVATHFPMLNKHGLYPLKLYQHRSYVIAYRNAAKIRGMYVDECDTGMSFRGYGDLLLIGGGGHRTGKNGGNYREIENFAKKHYKSAEPVASFATQDCISLDGIPYIGAYSPSLEDVFVATGFNKWGMTNAMVSADVLTDAVLGRKSPYAELFSPSRTVLRTQLVKNGVEAIKGLITPSAPRCPHLGCALKYNKEEHSWDCPCHGSRFTEDGALIDGPATDGKEMKAKERKKK